MAFLAILWMLEQSYILPSVINAIVLPELREVGSVLLLALPYYLHRRHTPKGKT